MGTQNSLRSLYIFFSRDAKFSPYSRLVLELAMGIWAQFNVVVVCLKNFSWKIIKKHESFTHSLLKYSLPFFFSLSFFRGRELVGNFFCLLLNRRRSSLNKNQRTRQNLLLWFWFCRCFKQIAKESTLYLCLIYFFFTFLCLLFFPLLAQRWHWEKKTFKFDKFFLFRGCNNLCLCLSKEFQLMLPQSVSQMSHQKGNLKLHNRNYLSIDHSTDGSIWWCQKFYENKFTWCAETVFFFFLLHPKEDWQMSTSCCLLSVYNFMKCLWRGPKN